MIFFPVIFGSILVSGLSSLRFLILQALFCVGLSHAMGLKFNKSVVGHLGNFCVTFTPTHLAGRINCTLKVLWVGQCPNLCTISLAWLQMIASSGYVYTINRDLCSGPSHRFQRVSTSLGFYFIPEICTLSIPVNSPRKFSLYHHCHLILPVPISTCPSSICLQVS